jgi:hypothetical protein
MSQKLMWAVCVAVSIAASGHIATAQTRVIGGGLHLPPPGPVEDARGTSEVIPVVPLPRNFGAVHPPKTPIILPVGYGTPNLLVRPWYLAPYRYYSYYRPWYTFGYYGPIYHRYHYSPSWGYPPLPFYAPPYLSPAGYGPPDYSGCYYW